MSQVMVQVALDDIVAGLTCANVRLNEAKIAAALLVGGPLSTKDFLARGLSQPIVSMATQPMREAGWIGATPISRGGMGRPVYAYDLTLAGRSHYLEVLRAAQASVERAMGAFQ